MAGFSCKRMLTAQPICSPGSLKTNPRSRCQAFGLVQGEEACTSHGIHAAVPGEKPESYDVGLFLPFNQEVYDRACATLLPPSTVDEELFYMGLDSTQDLGDKDELSQTDSLEGPNGMLVTESAELDVADIMTQA